MNSQYATGSVCRSPNYYVDPDSEQLIELGTKTYPYKTMRAVFSEILNIFAHKDVNITVYLKEASQVYISDSTNFVLNVTSVKITSYSDRSSTPSRATLVPTRIQIPAAGGRTAFHILAHTELKISETIASGAFTDSEKLQITQPDVTILVARSSIYIDNINIRREYADRSYKSRFLWLVYLQNKWLDVRRVDFNLTGNFVGTVDPLNVYYDQILIDAFMLMDFNIIVIN